VKFAISANCCVWNFASRNPLSASNCAITFSLQNLSIFLQSLYTLSIPPQWRIQKLWKGGVRQRIGLVIIYRKCTQLTICLLYGKRRLIARNSEPVGAPLNPPLYLQHSSVLICSVHWCHFALSITLYIDDKVEAGQWLSCVDYVEHFSLWGIVNSCIVSPYNTVT